VIQGDMYVIHEGEYFLLMFASSLNFPAASSFLQRDKLLPATLKCSTTSARAGFRSLVGLLRIEGVFQYDNTQSL